MTNPNPEELAALHRDWLRDQQDAAARELYDQTTAKPGPRDSSVEAKAVAGGGIDLGDLHATMTVIFYAECLRTGRVQTCAHLDPNRPAREWWTSAFPAMRWCERTGCNPESVNPVLSIMNITPAICLACRKRTDDVTDRVRVTIDNAVLDGHFCGSCEPAEGQE